MLPEGTQVWAVGKESDSFYNAAEDVFILEPGLYDLTEGWAVRLEDMVHLGEDGLETLTPLPYDLDPRAWVGL